jgi:2,4-dienoyl-CoA reductase-like NADH-dependent reductase (Old Yellow Enzyme family)/thioredoxin reductase
VRNPLVPGFEPTGVGANGPGLFRHPLFVERLTEMMDRLHAAGGFGSVQMVLQGGMPIAPSPTLSSYADHRVPHALSADEVAWMVREYGESAALAAEAGTDAIELHSNHDDLLQWFLSPLTNQRTDGYGGSFENRRRFVREVVESIRDHVPRPITLGLRLCLDEMMDGGYDIEECQRLLAAFTADGTVDYFSMDVGSNWGTVSYIPPGLYPEAAWAPLCGQAKQATHLPVVYVGRVVRPQTAERVLADGHADLVGFARAMIADQQLVVKARRGELNSIRPCLGVNDCIDRRVVEGLEFACAANPTAGREVEGAFDPTEHPRSILVVGGGPAGTEVAALASERGHRVRLWEREDQLGGQLAIAALARMNTQYADWIRWQERRLGQVGVEVKLGYEVAAADVADAGADVVVVATGARPRRPDVPGLDLPHVVGAADALRGVSWRGRRTLVVSEDDRAAPLVVADHLAGLGHEVTVVFQSTAPSPLVGKYTIGAILARLDAAGVEMVATTRVIAIEPDAVQVAHCYSGRRWALEGFDHVVLACGAVPDDALFHAVRASHPEVHLLGDAYAPRRMVYATRQAYVLASLLD